ncbi:MAG: ACT domain-containing protein [Acidobacteria bacterium]|nr:ACT domain-containing protein [Acidobacteriota bacterium]
MPKTLRLKVLPELLAVCRLSPSGHIPDWAKGGSIWSVSATGTELSIVCEWSRVPADLASPLEAGWRAVEIEGPIPFGLTGILASLLNLLAGAGIRIFAFSTFDTDFVMVKQSDWHNALAALKAAGPMIL